MGRRKNKRMVDILSTTVQLFNIAINVVLTVILVRNFSWLWTASTKTLKEQADLISRLVVKRLQGEQQEENQK